MSQTETLIGRPSISGQADDQNLEDDELPVKWDDYGDDDDDWIDPFAMEGGGIMASTKTEVIMASTETNTNTMKYPNLEEPCETAFMVTNEELTWRKQPNLPQTMRDCSHKWEDNSGVPKGKEHCKCCSELTNSRMRAFCTNCELTVCPMCSRFILGKKIPIKTQNLSPYDNKDKLINELLGYINFLLAENEWLKLQLMEETLEKEEKDVDELEKSRKGKGILIEEDEEEEFAKEFSRKVVLKEEANTITEESIETLNATANQIRWRRVVNRLYNMEVKFRIPGMKDFVIQAILDTGASACCINENAVPKEELEPSAYPTQITGVNSQQISTQKLKCGQMIIDENKFPIPFTYAFPMKEKDGTQMLIGCNFIRAMQGGLRIEGQTVTFYKNVTSITTKMDTLVAAEAAIHELDLAEPEYLEIKEIVAYNCGDESPWFRRKFNNLLERLKQQGFIGESPLRHWEKNQVTCYLEIINPDLTIQDKPLKHVTPAMKDQFERHVQALLKIGVIRPSKSRHRTMAIMVNSGTSIDPISKQEIKGKERIVFNYRTFNDNTHKDQYSLPGINTILKRIGNSKIFSKFDLKSGFHQVAMHPDSIPWTAFVVPGGLYEWLVMPFGLKNAPAIFQRKMDECFRGTEGFIAVYIDDILVFSENEEQHAKHLGVMLSITEKWGLVLSPTKMKIAVKEIEFLGAVICNRKIKLQPPYNQEDSPVR